MRQLRTALHRWALSLFRRLPRRIRLFVVRTVTPSYTIGALCMIEHDGRLLMLRQRHRYGWTLPGGLVNRGESAEAAACREVLEETGLRVEVGVPVAVLVQPGVRWVDVLFHIPVRSRPVARPASEAIRAEWLTPDEAGRVDESTRKAFAVFDRARRPGAREGRLISPGSADPPKGTPPPPRAASG